MSFRILTIRRQWDKVQNNTTYHISFRTLCLIITTQIVLDYNMFRLEPREGVIIYHGLVVITLLGRITQRPLLSGPLFSFNFKYDRVQPTNSEQYFMLTIWPGINGKKFRHFN